MILICVAAPAGPDIVDVRPRPANLEAGHDRHRHHHRDHRGMIIGALGRLVVPGKQNIPIWLTIVVGVVAALLGTVLANAIFGVASTARHRLHRAGVPGRHRRHRRRIFIKPLGPARDPPLTTAPRPITAVTRLAGRWPSECSPGWCRSADRRHAGSSRFAAAATLFVGGERVSFCTLKSRREVCQHPSGTTSVHHPGFVVTTRAVGGLVGVVMLLLSGGGAGQATAQRRPRPQGSSCSGPGCRLDVRHRYAHLYYTPTQASTPTTNRPAPRLPTTSATT